MDTPESSAPAHPSTAEPSEHDQDERLHACTDGVVYIGHLVEEVEVFETIPCRRCAGEDH